MVENFYNDIYYYYPQVYYPGYRFSRQQEKKYIAQYPYIQKESDAEKELQIFYNTTTYANGDSIPWGSTYKYTIPKSIDDIDISSHNSISERQKRFRRELFENTNNIKKKSKIDLELFFIFLIIIILINIIR
jgi:hypothetical protein